MAAPDISLVKAWCRVDGTEFDAVLTVLIAGATALAQNLTGADYATAEMPAAVQMWVCVHVKYWLDNPEDDRNKPLANVDGLLDPYRAYTMEVLTVVA